MEQKRPLPAWIWIWPIFRSRQFNGQFVLTHCVEDWKTFVSDRGNYRLDRGTYTRSQIDLNPDFAKLGFRYDGWNSRGIYAPHA